MTANECRSMNDTLLRPGFNESTDNWFIWKTYCVPSCPRGLERDPVLGCKVCPGKCVLVCESANVESIQAAQALKDCTYINGSLEIHITTGNQTVLFKELEENLGDIEEIAGYLKITRSFPLTNLNFFKNLRIIHGIHDFITPMNYALIVLENQNLQELWDWDNRPAKRNFTIRSGRIFFHYNPNLCLKHIHELASIAGQKDITKHEVAVESNGNKFACFTVNLQVTVHERFSNEVRIVISRPYNEKNDKYNMIRFRYMVYYIEAPFQNLTTHYDTNECTDYIWTIKDVSETEETVARTRTNGSVYYTLEKLEPNTQYAFFVKTYTVDSTGGQSPIQYFKTLPSKPTWPNDLYGVSTNISSITLFWSPPDKPNGHIIEYSVLGFLREEEQELFRDSNFCSQENREFFVKKKIETTTALPEFMTKVIKEEEDDCCNKGIHTDVVLSSETAPLCQNLNPNDATLPSSFLNKMKATTCEKYMYNLMETKILDPPSLLSKRDINVKNNFANSIDQYDIENKIVFFFRRSVPGNTTNVTFTDLDPYSLYTFEVKACREVDSAEISPTEEKRCSISTYATVRTLADMERDKLKWLAIEVKNRSVELMWQVPVKPNSIILSYDIEYRRTDIPNSRPITDCIRAVDYYGSYLLPGLALGNYAFRVRTVSLAGIGPFSDFESISITEFSSKSIILVSLLITFFIFLVVVSIVLFLYFKKKLMFQQNVLIASVNPEYFRAPIVDEEWELPRERVQVIKELKRGNFGVVCEGLLLPEETRVAVKKVIENAQDRNCIEFLNEAYVMKQFTSAYHIVKLIGIVSKDRPQLVVMEMMDNGDLKSYLRECRNRNPPLPSQMLLMAAQIADGMAFLEASKFVHRDLAARNCMVRADLVVKIGDFGMTRDIYETDYYRKCNKGLLPIRWMAPESLNDGVFTSKSDAWSYGVVLWEMTTLASQPYQGMSNEQVLTYVIAGNKLDLPPIYPKPFKAIMFSCWRWKPKFRPSFLQILDELAEYTTKGFREVSYYDSPEGKAERELIALHPQQCLFEQNNVSLGANSAFYHRI